MKFVIDIFSPDGDFTEKDIREALFSFMNNKTSCIRGGFSVLNVDRMPELQMIKAIRNLSWHTDLMLINNKKEKVCLCAHKKKSSKK